MAHTKIKKLILAIIAIQTGLVALTLHTISHVLKDIRTDWAFRLFAMADFTTLLFSCIILLAFMMLLNKEHAYYKANLYVYLILIANIMIFTVSQFEMPPPALQALILIVYGIATVSFSAKVIKCPDDLGGFKKTYSYITGFSGLCIATIIFLRKTLQKAHAF